MKLVTVSEMRAIEQEADASGLTYTKMMENAGSGLAKEISQLAYSQLEEREVIGLVGPGNNGGDTLVALAHLAAQGWHARAYLVHRNPEKDALVANFKEEEGEVTLAEKDEDFEQLAAFLSTATVVMDGILGTGTQLPLKEDVARVLQAAQTAIKAAEWPPYVVAVDCPSGVDCDTGEAAAECIQADLTVTMAAIKQGLLKLPAYNLVGDLRMVNIGSLEELSAWKAVVNYVADDDMVRNSLPPRPADAHKGTFGTALVVAGSINYTGAAYLAGNAAYRVGAGLVTMAVPAPLHGILAGGFPEATWVLLPHEIGVISSDAVQVLLGNLDRTTAMLVGPGLGLEATTGGFMENLILSITSAKGGAGHIGFVHPDQTEPEAMPWILPPMIFDADGLKLLAKIKNWYKRLPASVLTPHPGEMAILTGLAVEEIQKDRLALARKYARKWGHVIVLKGAFTVVASPDGRTATIPVANPALARAGSGDVLAGLIVGLRAQGVPAYEAGVAGAWIHAQAGLYAMEETGSAAAVLAGDILNCINDVMAELQT